jgi:hypothetical protein
MDRNANDFVVVVVTVVFLVSRASTWASRVDVNHANAKARGVNTQRRKGSSGRLQFSAKMEHPLI